MAGSLLEVSGLTKTFSRRGRDEVRAVDNIALQVGVNEVVGILGPNGAGKTTTIKCICGLVTPTGGQVVIAGIDALAERRRAAHRISAVLEGNRTIYWRLSVRENLDYYASLRGVPRSAIRDRIDAVIERFGLEDKTNTPAMKLSRGMQQKLALACAVLVESPLLLLDEPTLGLDVETSHELRGYLRSIAAEDGRGVLLSSHDMQVVRDVCDRVVIINHGRVVVDDRVENLLALFRARTFRVTLGTPLAPAALLDLRASFDVTDAGADTRGEGFHVDVALPDAGAFYDLVDALRATGAVIESMDRIEPNLEDVFLSVVKGRPRPAREEVGG